MASSAMEEAQGKHQKSDFRDEQMMPDSHKTPKPDKAKGRRAPSMKEMASKPKFWTSLSKRFGTKKISGLALTLECLHRLNGFNIPTKKCWKIWPPEHQTVRFQGTWILRLGMLELPYLRNISIHNSLCIDNDHEWNSKETSSAGCGSKLTYSQFPRVLATKLLRAPESATTQSSSKHR